MRWAAVFSVWLVVISYRYVNAAIQGFRSPFTSGDDIRWFAIWLALAVVMIVLAAIVKRAGQIVFWITAAACLLALILSGTFFAALAAAAILAVAHVLGQRLLLLFGAKPGEMAITIPLGLVVPALGGFALAALHVLSPMSIGIMLVLAALAGGRGLKPATTYSRGSLGQACCRGLQPALLIAPVIFLNLTWAVAPEIQFDANNYHLAVSQSYLDNRGFIDIPYSFHSYFYRFVDMLFTIALALHGPAAAKLLSFSFGLIACLGVFSLGRELFDERTGLWAAAFFYTTPVVSWVSGTAYVDNAVAMLLTATVIAFLRWHREREQTVWLYAASLLAGATIAAKVNAAFGLPVMLAVAVWHLRKRPRSLAICALLTLAVTLPWYLLTYYWTGNPVLPMMNGIFKSPLWEPENRVMDANAYGIGTSPGALLRLPFNLTWNTVRFGVATPRGAAGIALLLAIPFGFALLRKRRSAAIVFTAALLYFLLWAFSFQNIRYYAHFLPMLCVLGVATVLHFSHHRLAGSINRVCLAGLLVFQFSATPMQFWNIPERFPIAAAFGLETRQDLLRRSLRSYAAAERLNAEVKPGERVLGMDVEDARFYLKAPLETLKDSTRISVLRPASSLSGESLLHTLRQSGFAYIFATHESMKEPAVWYPYLKREFLEDFAIPIFSDDYAVVYRLAM